MDDPSNFRAMRIKLTDDRRERVVRSIRGFFADQFDEELSDFKTQRILEFFVRELGPPVYNQAIRDASKYFHDKLADLEGEFYEPEDPYSK